MSTIAVTPRREGGLAALLKHSRYVIAENPVTGFAFALFVLIVLAAILGPELVPYNPLSSDTAQALKPPSVHHWFGTDQIGRDVFSRVIVATRLDFFIAVASVALVFLMGGLAGVAAGFFGGWTDRIVGRIADTIMAFPLFVLAMGIVAALGNTVQNIVLATAIVNFPLYARIARAEANIRRQFGLAHSHLPNSAQRIPDPGRADVADHGLRDPQRRRPVFHRPRRASANARMGHNGRRRRAVHRLGRMVERIFSRRRTDGCGVLLQPAR
jgi:Binding-protein-dependent transport system inner membrane component/N-terminal TM domain of oligopeptide transport permease C